MLPVYKAIGIERAPIRGGSSHPCIMQVEDEQGELMPWQVVKLYKREHQTATLREVLGNVLASEFDLAAPPAALVELDWPILKELRLYDPVYQNKNLEPGVYFATEYLEGGLDFSLATHISTVTPWQVEQIFAFDVLLRNADRRTGKPNLFLYHGQPMLIDHELSLNIAQPFHNYYNQHNHWDFIREGPHLFLYALRARYKKSPFRIDGFAEFIRTLNPQRLFPYATQLTEYECDSTQIGPIVDYLNGVKSQPDRFLKLVNHLLQ